MRRDRSSVLTVVAGLVVGVVLSAGTATAVEQEGPGGGTGLPVSLRVDPDRLVTVVVQLSGDPIAVHQARAKVRGDALGPAAVAQAISELQAAQEPVAAAVEHLGGTVAAHLQHAYNGVRVRVRASALGALVELPGVRAVHPVPLVRPDLMDGLPAIGAPEAWDRYDVTGDGVEIAIIDTGIDYLHADFDGPGEAVAYEANDPEVIEPGTFPTGKVVGGWDFVGDEYDPTSTDPAQAAPEPDPDPLDCHGHGTHVAGIAAGTGVTADGETYDGPYAARSSSDPTRFAVPPGVAPRAKLHALKVFGCAGPTDVTIDAVDWAVARGVDVINLSLGTPLGFPDSPLTAAVNNAALAGVTVVVSAGNDGAAGYAVGDPSTAAGAISVAAVDAIAVLPVADLAIAGGSTIRMQNSNDAPLPAPIVGPIAVLEDHPDTPADESLGCEPGDYAGTEGAIVVTVRGECDRVLRAQLGQEAGAVAVVMLNTEDGLPPFERTIPGVAIPFLGVGAEHTDEVRAADGDTASITDAGTVPNPSYGHEAPFTSGGPASITHAAKPDVAAPGVAVLSAGAGTGWGSRTLSGTSMAAPFVTGVAALVRQAHPDWDVAARGAAIINTADPGVLVDPLARLLGSGMVRAPAAIGTPVIALADGSRATTSFGLLEGPGPLTSTRRITIQNRGDVAAGFDVSIEADPDLTGASVTADRTAIVVPGGGSASVDVTLTSDGAAVPGGFQPLGGAVLLRPTAGPPGVTDLRVPYQGVLRSTSSLTTTPIEVDVTGSGTVTFDTVNRSPVPGTVEVFSWGLADLAGDAPLADVRAVGVRSASDGSGAFAINLHTALTTPSAYLWEVLIDREGDGTVDRLVVGLDGSLVDQPFGTLVSAVFDVPTEELVAVHASDTDLNTSTVLLPFEIEDLGVERGGGPFTYQVLVSRGDPAVVEVGHEVDVVTGAATFDPYRPALETGQMVTVAGNDHEWWTADVDADRLAESPQRGWLLVYRRNPLGERSAQLVEADPVVVAMSG